MYGMNFLVLRDIHYVAYFCVVGIFKHQQTKQGLLQECSANNTQHTWKFPFEIQAQYK